MPTALPQYQSDANYAFLALYSVIGQPECEVSDDLASPHFLGIIDCKDEGWFLASSVAPTGWEDLYLKSAPEELLVNGLSCRNRIKDRAND
jgi:hypothetical protein